MLVMIETVTLFDGEEQPLDLAAAGGRATVRPGMIMIMPNRPLSSDHLNVEKEDCIADDRSCHYYKQRNADFSFWSMLVPI